MKDNKEKEEKDKGSRIEEIQIYICMRMRKKFDIRNIRYIAIEKNSDI